MLQHRILQALCSLLAELIKEVAKRSSRAREIMKGKAGKETASYDHEFEGWLSKLQDWEPPTVLWRGREVLVVAPDDTYSIVFLASGSQIRIRSTGFNGRVPMPYLRVGEDLNAANDLGRNCARRTVDMIWQHCDADIADALSYASNSDCTSSG